jgi:hypothetical protein
MRCSLPTFCLLIMASAWAGAPASPPPVAPLTRPAAATPPKAPAPAESSADNEAAAKHAKRTACLSQARAKKLVGTRKTAFVKDCIGPR